MAGPLGARFQEAWDRFWSGVGSEEWLAAKALLELSSIHVEAASWLQHSIHENQLLAWVHDVDTEGRGWSSTERRLFRLVAALIDPHPEDTGDPLPPWTVRVEGPWGPELHRLAPLSDLASMGSWEADVWRILVEWGTGGNSRERRGRLTAVPLARVRPVVHFGDTGNPDDLPEPPSSSPS